MASRPAGTSDRFERRALASKVAIVSLRCNPAFIQHLIAFAKATRELGYEAGFILDPGYRRFPELTGITNSYEDSGSSEQNGWTTAIFLNVAVENWKLAKQLKASSTKLLYVYHEPWQFSFDYVKTEGIAATARAILAHRASVPMLKTADTVILESQCGMDAYQRMGTRFNQNFAHLPQIYDDDAPSDFLGSLTGKRYFSFIGALCRSHGFDQYVAYMRRSLERGSNVKFLIASRQPLPDHVANDPLIRTNREKVEIRCGRPLRNDEMNRCYEESFCIWNLYRRSTQSGVLPKALMFGTPVIATDTGSFREYIQDGVNGRFALADDSEGISAALNDIQERIVFFAENCRKTFLGTFYYRSRLADLQRLLL